MLTDKQRYEIIKQLGMEWFGIEISEYTFEKISNSTIERITTNE